MREEAAKVVATTIATPLEIDAGAREKEEPCTAVQDTDPVADDGTETVSVTGLL